jgi:hypothetical protein
MDYNVVSLPSTTLAGLSNNTQAYPFAFPLRSRIHNVLQYNIQNTTEIVIPHYEHRGAMCETMNSFAKLQGSSNAI